MEVSKNKSASRRIKLSPETAGYLIPEPAFNRIQAINSQLRFLREMAQRPDGETIIITASALEETLSLIEEELSNAIAQADFLSH